MALTAMVVALMTVVLGLASCGGERHRHRREAESAPASAAAPPVLGVPRLAAPDGVEVGASVNTLFNNRDYAPAQIDAQLAALRLTGATIARSDALWDATELAPPVNGVHHYAWSFDDNVAASLARRGLKWLPIVDYTAPWAQSIPGQEHSPPRSAGDFAAFAGALAQRYGPGGTFWRAHPELTPQPIDTYEVWNEPDGGFWLPAPDAPAYTKLYLRTREAIEAVAPASRVLVGGLAHPLSFLPAMLAAQPGLAGHLDGVAIHLYFPRPADVLAALRAVRHLMDGSGMAAVPLYITEFGWSVRPPHNRNWAPESARPGYIAQTLTALGRSNCDVAAALLYSWTTPERDPANLEDWYGIHPPPPAGGATPDTRAFADAVRAAHGRGPRAHVCS